jgi:hypothetical protein
MISNFIKTLKKDLGYKTWKDQFTQYVNTKDRLANQPISYYLVYDLDSNSFSIKSEFSINYNHVVIVYAKVPSKKEVNKDIEIKDYEYKS